MANSRRQLRLSAVRGMASRGAVRLLPPLQQKYCALGRAGFFASTGQSDAPSRGQDFLDRERPRRLCEVLIAVWVKREAVALRRRCSAFAFGRASLVA